MTVDDLRRGDQPIRVTDHDDILMADVTYMLPAAIQALCHLAGVTVRSVQPDIDESETRYIIMKDHRFVVNIDVHWDFEQWQRWLAQHLAEPL